MSGGLKRVNGVAMHHDFVPDVRTRTCCLDVIMGVMCTEVFDRSRDVGVLLTFTMNDSV